MLSSCFFARTDCRAGPLTCWQLPRACRSRKKACSCWGELHRDRAFMIEPRLSKGTEESAVGEGPPPEGIGRLPIGKDELPIGRDELPMGKDERGTAMGLVSCWEAAAAGAKSAGCSAVLPALVLSDASSTPEFKHFTSAVCITQFLAPASVHMMH